MIECPECMEVFSGRRCKCGYIPRNAVGYIHPPAARDEKALTEQSQAYLQSIGVHKPGMTRAEKTRASIDHFKRLGKTAAKYQVEPHAWAYEILTKIADGEWVTQFQEAAAREVTGIYREEREAA